MSRRKGPILLVLLLVMLTIAGCGRRSAPNPAPTNKEQKTPSSAERFVPFAEQDLGVAVYPGAVQAEGFKQEEGNTFSIAARFTTSDEYSKVQAFYNERYPSALPTEMTGSLFLSLLDKKYTTVRMVDGNPVTIIIEQQGPH